MLRYRNKSRIAGRMKTTVSQKYKLSVVSGGKPVLPHSINKNISCLTYDSLNYIVPFNNQIKIYSIETRKCIKTIKFNNNDLLSTIFDNEKRDDIYIASILHGDITKKDNNEELLSKFITVITNTGVLIVLNYKGKLIDNPTIVSIFSEDDNQTILKCFKLSNNKFKILTSFELNSNSNYKIWDLAFDESGKSVIQEDYVFNSVVLSNWSADSESLVILNKESPNVKTISTYSLQHGSVVNSFPLLSIFNTKENSSNVETTDVNKFVTSLAINNSMNQIAIGFASGVIHLVSLDSGSNTNVQSRIMKWHIDSVLTLCFTNDDSYLISGGWEKVLCFWQLSTSLQQFLPRLNGVIMDCQVVDKFYSISLQMTENQTNSDYQLLLLNSADLTSKLSINGPLAIFNNQIKDWAQPISITSPTTKTRKQKMKKLLKLKKHDFTTCIEINSQTKQLYIPHQNKLQTFDFYRNEQINLQFLTDGMQNNMGKVRNELEIRDPEIKELKLTNDGKWLITYEIEYSPQDLLSSNDLNHILKFWSLNVETNLWELTTKVLNPHGNNAPIMKLLTDNFNGIITADNNGGLKYWKYIAKENNWCLTKLSLPNFNHFNNSVSLACSKDNSLIFHGFDDKLQIIDFETFKPIESPSNSTLTMDSEIQSIKLINESNLIVATKTSLNVIDLLVGKITNSFDLYPFVNNNYKNGHLDRLISCDEKNGKVAIVINEQVKDNKNSLNYKAHILIFTANLSNKLGSFTHNNYVSWIGWNYDTDFIFMDWESKLGVVGTTINTEMSDEINKEGILDGLSATTNNTDYLEELRKLSIKKVKMVEDPELENDMDIDLETIDGNKTDGKLINMNSFSNLFENIDNIQMDSLFDNVMKILS